MKTEDDMTKQQKNLQEQYNNCSDEEKQIIKDSIGKYQNITPAEQKAMQR